MDLLQLLSLLLAPITGVATYLVGRKVRLSQESNVMLESMKNLQEAYAGMLEEMRSVRDRNVQLYEDNALLREQITAKDSQTRELKRRVDKLQKEIEHLRAGQQDIRSAIGFANPDKNDNRNNPTTPTNKKR